MRVCRQEKARTGGGVSLVPAAKGEKSDNEMDGPGEFGSGQTSHLSSGMPSRACHQMAREKMAWPGPTDRPALQCAAKRAGRLGLPVAQGPGTPITYSPIRRGGWLSVWCPGQRMDESYSSLTLLSSPPLPPPPSRGTPQRHRSARRVGHPGAGDLPAEGPTVAGSGERRTGGRLHPSMDPGDVHLLPYPPGRYGSGHPRSTTVLCTDGHAAQAPRASQP